MARRPLVLLLLSVATAAEPGADLKRLSRAKVIKLLRINTTRACSAPLTDLLCSVRTTQSSEHSASLAPQITVAVAAEHPPMPHGGLCNQTITARFAKALPQMAALM